MSTKKPRERFHAYDLDSEAKRELEKRARTILYGEQPLGSWRTFDMYRDDLVDRMVEPVGLTDEQRDLIWALVETWASNQFQRAHATAIKQERERILRELANDDHPLDPRTLAIIGNPGDNWWFSKP